ncbi:MAG: TldD/PmbA family protein [Candidatus Micrarchaeia archaeon]
MDLQNLVQSCEADYADVRITHISFVIVEINDGKVENVVEANDWEAGVRVLHKGSWGFASTNNERNLSDALERALRLAHAGKGNARLSDEEVVKEKFIIKPKRPMYEMCVEEKVKLALEADKEMQESRIKTRTVLYRDAFVEKTFLSSEGAEIFQVLPSVYIRFYTIARSAGKMAHGFSRLGGHGGHELIANFLEKAKETREKAISLLDASVPKAGRRTVVIDGKMAGVLAHEAVGHASEADSVVGKTSAFVGMLGKKIADESVTIVDEPILVNAFGGFAFDDEGVRAWKTYIVKGGILNSYLHSRETAAIMGTQSTGNMRGHAAEMPIVRMSNTFFEAGDMEFDELIDIKEGVYLCGVQGGAVTPKTGEFIFTSEDGYEIKNGELRGRLRDAMISGNILETLLNVDGLGKERTFSLGVCGKHGKHINVGDGGPHIRLTDVFVAGK